MNNEMEKLLNEENDIFQEVHKGKTVKGSILIKRRDEYYVDIKHKTDGILPRSEMIEGEELNEGDEVYFKVTKVDKTSGEVFLSRKKAQELEIFDSINIDEIVNVKVQSENKKGLIVFYKNVLRGFIPLSHVELDYLDKNELGNYIGKEFEAKIIDLDKDKRRFILSRKDILKNKMEQKKNDFIELSKETDTFKGTIKDIKDYGLFVDVNGITGLVHISEVSWEKNINLKDRFKNNQEIDVKVISFDEKQNRLALSIKQLEENPWVKFLKEYKEDDEIKGIVKNIKDYGVFVKLNDFVDGFVHISNLSKDFIKHPKDIVKLDDELELKIINIDGESKKVELKILE